MKRVIYLCLMFIVCFFVFTFDVNAEGKFFKETSTSNMFDFRDADSWGVDYSYVNIVGDRVIVETVTDYRIEELDESQNSKYSFHSEGIYNTFNLDGTVNNKKVFQDYSNDLSSDYSHYNHDVFGDYLYYFDFNSIDDNLYIVKLDKDLNIVDTFTKVEDNGDYFDSHVFLENGDIMLFFTAYNYENSGACFIYHLSNDFEAINSVECNDENKEKYFSDFLFREEKQAWFYDKWENEFVFVDSDGKSLNYFVDDKEVFKISSSGFRDVKFFDDFIIVKNNLLRNDYDYSHYSYYSTIDVYDKKGNLVQTINENSFIEDFEINEETKQIFISSIYIDGFCQDDFYYFRPYNSTCKGNLEYSVYTYGTHDEVVEDKVEETPESSTKPSQKPSPIPNPDTKDVGIITFILLFFSTLYFYIKAYKERNEY